MPFIGTAAEWIDTDVSNGFERTLSGGKAIYGMGGLLLRFEDKFSIFLKGELPVIQDYKSPDGNVFTNLRAQVQLSYFFKSKSKISKSVKL